MESAHVDDSGDLGESQVLALVFTNKGLCLGDPWRFSVAAPDQDLVAQNGKMLSKDAEQLSRRRVLVTRDDASPKVGFPQLVLIVINFQSSKPFDCSLKLPFRWAFAEDLAGLQEAYQPVSQLNRHGGLA